MGSVACTAICFQLSATGALYLFLLSKKKRDSSLFFSLLFNGCVIWIRLGRTQNEELASVGGAA